MKIALYSGTFNPIHIGHLTVINYSFEKINLDLLYIVPNKNPVHKKRDFIIDPEIRLSMIKLSVEKLSYKSRIRISDFEIKSEYDSYTFYTVEHFRNMYLYDQLFFIVGLDSLLYYYWHNFELIFKMIDTFLLIKNIDGVKDDNIIDFMKGELNFLMNENKEHNKELLNILEYGMYNNEKFILLDVPRFKISSSLILQRVREGKAIDYWVNEKVKHMLYKIVPVKGRNSNEHTR